MRAQQILFTFLVLAFASLNNASPIALSKRGFGSAVANLADDAGMLLVLSIK